MRKLGALSILFLLLVLPRIARAEGGCGEALQGLRAEKPVMSPVVPADAEQIDHWFGKGAPDVTYDDPKWREWWKEKCRNPDAKTSVFKLTLPDGRIAGVIALQDVVDYEDRQPTTMIVGIRVSPSFSGGKNAKQRTIVGAGSALMRFAAEESIKRGTSGIGLNASVGAEGFYRKLGMQEREAFDKIRRYFFVKGDVARNAFLKRNNRR